MKFTKVTPVGSRVLKPLALALAAACSANAFALEFETESGWHASLNTTFTASSAWRAEAPDKSLIGARDAIATGLYSDAAGIAAGCTVGAGVMNPVACSNGASLPHEYNAYWLRAVQAGYRGGAQTDAPTINYAKGSRYSTQAKVLTELSMKKDTMGGVIRVKGWYDQALKDENVRMGSPANGFQLNTPLNDDTARPLNRFDGIELLDAYVYNSFDIGELPMQVRVGRQAVNWGESLFIQGVNQLAPLDISALRRAGTEIKEALLPVWSIYGNLALSQGMSLEGYYQLKWENSNLDDCGSYWSGTNGSMTDKAGNCNFGFPFYRDNVSAMNYGANPAALVFNQQPIGLMLTDGVKPKDSGQWGLALRIPVEALDTEFGLYAMNIHARLPVLSITEGGDLKGALANALIGALPGTAPLAGLSAQQKLAFIQGGGLGAGGAGLKTLLGQLPITGISGTSNFLYSALGGSLNPATAGLNKLLATAANGVAPTTAFWEYPEDMKVFGISAATTLAGWSIGAELSRTNHIAAQRNGNDLIVSAVLAAGPSGAAALGGTGDAATVTPISVTVGPNTFTSTYLKPNTGIWHGYDYTHKTQLQINGVNTLPSMLGAVGGLVVAEVGMQWNGLDDSNGRNVRYGRSFIYGNAPHNGYTQALAAAGLPASLAANALGCIDPAAMTAANPPTAGLPGVDVGSFFTNPQPQGCKNDGFITSRAWGYRIKASLDYPQVFGTSWTATPSVFWSHDVDGQAVDYQFNEGRKVLSLGLALNLNKMHNINLNYTTYANSADYDVMRDRDNYSIAYSYTF